jgi:ferredoxin-NADP reductase
MKCKTIAKRNLSKNVFEIIFRPQDFFCFVAGQSVNITIPGVQHDPIGNTRRFSIASPPTEQDISIIVRIHDNVYPFKQFLIHAPIGSEVEFSEPLGSLVLPKNENVEIVFIAGGIGITPFLSMIFFAYEKKMLYTIHLLYFNSSPEEEVYSKELRTLADNNKLFELSEFYGFLDEDKLKQVASTNPNIEYYIAGPPGMIEQAIQSLRKLGVQENQMKTEEFKGYTL